MRQIIYMGYSEKMLEILCKHKLFSCSLAIGTRGRMSPDYYKLIKQYNIMYAEVTDKQDLIDKIQLTENIDIIIMYKFEFIIPNNIVKTYQIFNFHGGNLLKNRGAHAVVWSILLREKETCLSCYQLTGIEIDEGYLIDSYPVTIDAADTPLTLNKKLAEGIPILLNSIDEYLSGQRKAELITGGIYRRKINKPDYTLQLYDDSLNTMEGKILSQQTYEGAVAIWDEVEYRIKKFDLLYNNEYIDKRIIEKNEDRVTIYENHSIFIMYLESR